MITLKFSIISFFIYNLLIYIYLYVFIYIHNFSWQYHIYHQLAIFRRLGLNAAATKVGGLSYFPYYLASHQILHVAGKRREEMRMFLLIINHILQDILAGNVDRLSIFLDTAGIVLHASHKQGLEIVQQIPVALDGAIHLLHRLRTNRMPWSVNQLAIEAGLHLLEHDVPNPLDVASYLQEAARLRSALEALGGLEVWATETHFMLVCLRMGRASALKDYLAGEHGILIRDASNFDGLNEHFFRIAAQSREENDRLVKAIGQWLEEE